MPSPLPPFSAAPRRAITILIIAALAMVALAGCAKDHASDSASLESRSIVNQLVGPNPDHGPEWQDQQRHLSHLPYPLAIGNRWDYVTRVTTTMTTDAGPQPPVTTEGPWLVVIADALFLEGRRYYVQSESDPRVMAPGPAQLFYVRQDRTGLYERDFSVMPLNAHSGPQALSPLAAQLIASVARMPAAASNPEAYRRAALELAQRVDRMLHPEAVEGSSERLMGPPPADLAMLRYPLFVGAGWIVRDSPRFARRVTGRELLQVPAGKFPAWRIAGSSELYGPNDRVNFWYGTRGLLRIQFHAETNAVDNTGAIIGTVLFDSDQVLTSVTLRGHTPIRAASAEEDGEQ